MNSLTEIFTLLVSLPLQQLAGVVAMVVTTLGAAYGLGCWITRQSTFTKHISLQSQIAKLERENAELKGAPKLSVALSGADNAIQRFGHLLRYNFSGENPIHPLIVEQFWGWLSDPACPVVALDIEAAAQSNKYYGRPIEIVSRKDGELWVHASQGDDGSMFRYRYLGSSPSGIHAVQTACSGGGSGTFYSILFFVFQGDSYLGYDQEGKKKDRVLLKCIGSLTLGDRYDGKIQFKNGHLTIGNRVDWYPEYRPESEVILIE